MSSVVAEWRPERARRSFAVSTGETPDATSKWREFLCEMYYPMEAFGIDKSHFRGRLDEIKLDFLQISTCEAEHQSVKRTRFHTKFDTSEQFIFLFPTKGVTRRAQFDRDCALNAFASTMVLCSEPYWASSSDDFANMIIRVPAALIRSRVANCESLCGTAHQRSVMINSVIWNMVAGFFNGTLALPSAEDPSLRRLAEIILELVVFVLNRELGGDEPADASHRGMIRNRIVEYLNAHLCDPTLSPQKVATANGISVSYMNKLLRPSGRSMARRVLDERLALCHARLSQASLRHLSIGRIAYDAGFNNQSYFTSRFRAKYGVTPRDIRRAAFADFDSGDEN